MGEERVKEENNSEPATLADVIAVVTDWKTWFFTLVGFCGGVSFQSSAIFLPSIVNVLFLTRVYIKYDRVWDLARLDLSYAVRRLTLSAL